MHINPFRAPACVAFEIIPLQGFTASLLPFPNIGSHHSAAPKMAFVSSLHRWFCGPVAFIAAHFFGGSFERYERRSANETGPDFFSTLSPSGFEVTLRRTIFGISVFERASRPIKRITARGALALLSILLPIEWLARYSFVPRCSHTLSIAQYAEMAMKRIKDDCPMFAEVAAE